MRNANFRFNYPTGCEHLHVTKRLTAILTIHGCAVRMGDAGRGRYMGMLRETSSDLGGHLLMLLCLFHLLVSLMH